MENYLGPKSKSDFKPILLVIAAFLLLAAVGVWALLADLGDKSPAGTDLAVDIGLIAVCLGGIGAAVLRILLRNRAFKIARYFYEYPKIEIDPGLAAAELKIKDPAKTLKKLQYRGYLSNIRIDRDTGVFYAYIKEHEPEQEESHKVKCPNCGSNCRVYPDRTNICPVCETRLVIGGNVDMMDKPAERVKWV